MVPNFYIPCDCLFYMGDISCSQFFAVYFFLLVYCIKNSMHLNLDHKFSEFSTKYLLESFLMSSFVSIGFVNHLLMP